MLALTIDNLSEETSTQMETTLLSMFDTKNKLLKLKHDYNQYQQLKKLQKIGSDIDTKKCPIYESDLYDTLSNSKVKRQPMTLEENIEFLQDQLDFFNAIQQNNEFRLHELQVENNYKWKNHKQLLK